MHPNHVVPRYPMVEGGKATSKIQFEKQDAPVRVLVGFLGARMASESHRDSVRKPTLRLNEYGNLHLPSHVLCTFSAGLIELG